MWCSRLSPSRKLVLDKLLLIPVAQTVPISQREQLRTKAVYCGGEVETVCKRMRFKINHRITVLHRARTTSDLRAKLQCIWKADSICEHL